MQVHREKVIQYNCHFQKLFLPMYLQVGRLKWLPFPLGHCDCDFRFHFGSSLQWGSVTLQPWDTHWTGWRSARWKRDLYRCLQKVCFSTKHHSPQDSKGFNAGLFWCPNLSVPDPTLILPVLVGFTFASTIFVSSVKGRVQIEQSEKLQKYSRIMTGVLYSIALVMVPIACYVPSAVALYWATSGAVGVLINLLLLHPPIRRAVRIPKIPLELEQPYKHLKENLKDKKFL